MVRSQVVELTTRQLLTPAGAIRGAVSAAEPQPVQWIDTVVEACAEELAGQPSEEPAFGEEAGEPQYEDDPEMDQDVFFGLS